MNTIEKIKALGYDVRPMEFKTIWCNGFDSVVDTWIDYRNEFVKRNADGTVDNIKNGKHYTKEEYDKEIFDMDISVSYMEMINLEISSSTAFREFLLQFDQTKAVWGKSSRDSADFTTYCSEEFASLPGTYDAYVEFKKVHDSFKAGEGSFDALRECLPIAYQTKFRIFLPVKQFMIYLAAFYECVHDVLPDTWKSVWAAVYKNEQLRPWLKKLNSYRDTEESRIFMCMNKHWDEKHTHDFDASGLHYRYLGKIGSVLYSQLIRMENSRTYGYSAFLRDLPKIKVPNCKATFPCWTAMSQERINEVMRTRASWFASNTYDGDPNAWNAFMKNVWHKEEDGSVKLENNWQYFKFLKKVGDKIIVDNEALARYLADDEGRFHPGYNRFFIAPYLIKDGRVILYRLHQQGYSKHMDLFAQIYKLGILKEDPNDEKYITWYKWVDEGQGNSDYRVWTEAWEYYKNNNISIKDLMTKFNINVKEN